MPVTGENGATALLDKPVEEGSAAAHPIRLGAQDLALGKVIVLPGEELWEKAGCGVVSLSESDLAGGRKVDLSMAELWTFASRKVVLLSKHDKAAGNLVRLGTEELWKNAGDRVLLLSEHDLASNTRIIYELPEGFFARHGLELDSRGVLILRESDLAEASEPVEKKYKLAPVAREKKNLPTQADLAKKERRIFRVCLAVIIFCMLGTVVNLHFKYSWIRVPEPVYEAKCEKMWNQRASAVGWFFSRIVLPLQYRTPGDGWYEWYGRKLLNAPSYEKAVEEQGRFLTLLRFARSNTEGVGESL